MKIQYLSDIHNEFGYVHTPKHKNASEITLVLAGDIDAIPYLKPFLREMAKKYKYVLFVPGNHEYYGQDFDFDWSTIDLEDNAYILDNDSVVLDGIRFVGGTLWTDFYNDPLALVQVGGMINDFYRITQDGFTLQPQSVQRKYNETVHYLTNVLKNAKEDTKVVITHFPPHLQCQDPKWSADGFTTMTKYFYPTVPDELFGMADHWIYGHSHSNILIEHNGCKVVSNQLGYQTAYMNEETGFVEGKLLEV